jgi:hypothetical protein
MSQLTRRRFVKQASKGVSAVGLLAAVPGIATLPTASAANTSTSQALASQLEPTTLAEPLVLHVRDLASGEIALLSGTKEIVYHDLELVRRLVRVAR